MYIQIAERTTIGRRQNNEDSTVAAQLSINGQDLTLLGVFDGVGGHADGEVASRIAANSLLALAPELVDELAAADGQLDHDEVKVKALAEQWRSNAAASLHQAAQKYNKHANMATTAVAAAMLGERLAIWWLGDSRAYLFRDGKLRQMTKDHSIVTELNLSEEDTLEHPLRNQITRFLRETANDAPDVIVDEWREGDVVLLVSDGVSGSLTSWELETFLAYWLVSDISAHRLADNLLAHIKENLSDNASVAVAIRGVPQPMGVRYPQVPLASLLCYGLAPDVLTALTKYPVNSAEWSSRVTPPWRQLDNAKVGLLNPGQPTPRPDGKDAFCPKCLEWITEADGCKNHPGAAPFVGTVVEILSEDGSRATFAGEGQLTLVSTAATLHEANGGDLNEDEIALQVQPQSGGVPRLRIRSPLGAQLQTHDIEILEPWPSPGLSFTVQNTLVVVRQTASGPLHDAKPPQVRQVQDLETTIAAAEDTPATVQTSEHAKAEVTPSSSELVEDASALAEPAAEQAPADMAD